MAIVVEEVEIVVDVVLSVVVGFSVKVAVVRDDVKFFFVVIVIVVVAVVVERKVQFDPSTSH